jgi:hypothetical protein
MGGEVIDITFDPAIHAYSIDGIRVPSVTQCLKACGFIEERGDEYAMKRGEYVHEATALDDMGRLDESTLDPVILPYVQAWRKFRKDSGFKPVKIEWIVGHPVYRYAGKLDREGEMQNDNWILDIKTGGEADWHPLQTALYAVAAEYMDGDVTIKRAAVYLRDNGSYSDVTIKRAAVYLRDNGTYVLDTDNHKNPADRADGLAAVRICHRKGGWK